MLKEIKTRHEEFKSRLVILSDDDTDFDMEDLLKAHQDRAYLLGLVEEANKVLKKVFKDEGWQYIWDMIVKIEGTNDLCPLCANPSIIDSLEEGIEKKCAKCGWCKEELESEAGE